MTAYLELSGAPLLSASISMPRRGAWIADVEHAYAPTVAAGDSVELVFGSQVFVGTVYRVNAFDGRGPDCRIIGGAGKLGTVLSPRMYRSPSLRNIVDDALREAGETLSSEADTATLAGLSLTSFERSRRTLGQLLDTVAAESGLDWRVLVDGTIWLGASTWETPSLTEYQVLEQGSDAGRITIASSDPTVYPGQTFEGIHVSMVQHRVDGDGTRTELYQEDAAERTLGVFDALARAAQPVDLYGFYQYEVLSQNADKTLELRSTDARLSDLSHVPMRFGVPGMTADLPSGHVVMVGFAGGNEQDPYVAAWMTGDATNLRLVVGTLMELGSSPATSMVALATLTDARITAIQAKLDAFILKYDLHTHLGVLPGPAVTAPPLPTEVVLGPQASVAATIVSAT